MEAHRKDRVAAIAYLPSATLVGADEPALARGLRADDPRALREAWRRFGPLAGRIALHATGSRSVAEATAARVFELFLDRVAGARDAATLTELVLSIAARELRRILRRQRLRRWLRLRTEEGGVDLPTREADPFDGEALDRLFVLANRLGPLDRIAFSLRFFERLTLSETAAALDLPCAKLERRLGRTWSRLARAVAEDATLAELLPVLAGGDSDDDDDDDDELPA